jgi:hypothetical protein
VTRDMHRPPDDDALSFPINTPQPIRVQLDDDFFALIKQDVVICRINRQDVDTLFNAARMLTGMCRAGIIFGEMEQMRDIMAEFLREANGS